MSTALRTVLPATAAAAVVSLLLSGVIAAPPAAGPQRPKSTQSRIERRTYEFKEAGEAGGASREMEYALFVPSAYDKAKPTPLVVALHGLYSNPQQIMRYPGLTREAERYGYIVVAPMGYNQRGWYGARPLVRGAADDPKNLSELSERDVLNVLAIVREGYNVDPDRIYLMGHSMGGGGTLHLAIKYPDLWAALAPIAPATLRPAGDVEKIRHIPVILVQGERDRLVRVERVRPWAKEMERLGMTHRYIEVPRGDHITVAFTTLPDIFAFFDKHRRQGGEGERDGEGE